MTVLFSATQTITSTLNTVTSVATGLSTGVQALADLAAVGALHSQHYRKTTEASLRLEADELEEMAIDVAAARIARKQLELQRELSADTDLADKFNEIRNRLNGSRRGSLSLAAE